MIQGSTTNKERERLFDAFRTGEIRTLVVSKVANFSIDLPEAAVAVQVSGTFGSRQEEAQRLGRVLRPKADGRQAHFYTVVAATPSTASTPRTGSASSPSRATRTRSSTPPTWPASVRSTAPTGPTSPPTEALKARRDPPEAGVPPTGYRPQAYLGVQASWSTVPNGTTPSARARAMGSTVT